MAPAATVCTVGIARPSAQGQVMISTATAVTIESCQLDPASTQPNMVSSAAACTTGAYSREARSASTT
jgi:hypothetical protein